MTLYIGPMPTPEDEIIGTDQNGFHVYAGIDGIKTMIPATFLNRKDPA